MFGIYHRMRFRCALYKYTSFNGGYEELKKLIERMVYGKEEK